MLNEEQISTIHQIQILAAAAYRESVEMAVALQKIRNEYATDKDFERNSDAVTEKVNQVYDAFRKVEILFLIPLKPGESERKQLTYSTSVRMTCEDAIAETKIYTQELKDILGKVKIIIELLKKEDAVKYLLELHTSSLILMIYNMRMYHKANFDYLIAHNTDDNKINSIVKNRWGGKIDSKGATRLSNIVKKMIVNALVNYDFPYVIYNKMCNKIIEAKIMPCAVEACEQLIVQNYSLEGLFNFYKNVYLEKYKLCITQLSAYKEASSSLKANIHSPNLKLIIAKGSKSRPDEQIEALIEAQKNLREWTTQQLADSPNDTNWMSILYIVMFLRDAKILLPQLNKLLSYCISVEKTLKQKISDTNDSKQIDAEMLEFVTKLSAAEQRNPEISAVDLPDQQQMPKTSIDNLEETDPDYSVLESTSYVPEKPDVSTFKFKLNDKYYTLLQEVTDNERRSKANISEDDIIKLAGQLNCFVIKTKSGIKVVPQINHSYSEHTNVFNFHRPHGKDAGRLDRGIVNAFAKFLQAQGFTPSNRESLEYSETKERAKPGKYRF